MIDTVETAHREVVTVRSQALGTIDVPVEQMITMCEPLAGFPDCVRYALLDHVKQDGELDGSIFWLQATEDPFQSFVITDPWGIAPDYAPEISDADAERLELRSFEDARVFAILTVPADTSMITANLRAPIVVNVAERLAKQVVLLGDEYHTRHSLSGPEESGESA
ncbi:MAG: flagellar assembly protein FliW [Miltoncostaeaceae bacterium]